MTRPIRFNGFAINAPVHLSPGLWTHPRDRSVHYKDLDHWVELARILERGLFESLFVADGIGVHDIHAGSADLAIRTGAQVPKHDPLMLVSAMAYATRHLGFSITASTSHEIPAVLARRFASLDHLTRGRIGWNIVTGYSESGARAVGRSGIIPHDARYDRADEFLEITYRLWEESWEENAVLRDRERGIFADPDKVHRIIHEGPHFRTDTIALTEPSLQRTPFLFQAGASPRGRAFAARHAEAVFLSAPGPAAIAPTVRDIRERAAANGRAAEDIGFFALATLVPGRSRAEAEEKLAEYRSHVDADGALALFSGWTGIDFSHFGLDDPLPRDIPENAVQSMIDSFVSADPGRRWTLREVLVHNGIGGRGPVFCGTPADIADALQDWVAATGIDGFNIGYAVMPESFVDVVDLVVPELQRRGVYRTEAPAGTLRGRLQGQDRLRPGHPGVAFRRRHAA